MSGQLGIMSRDSVFYRLISGAAKSTYGYKDLDTFYREAFKDYFDNSEWRSLLEVGVASENGQVEQVIKGRRVPVLAAYVADDGGVPKIGGGSAEIQSLQTLRTGIGREFNLKSVEEGARLLGYGATSVNSEAIFETFFDDNELLIGSLNVRRSYDAYFMESTGTLNVTQQTAGGGLRPLLIDYRVPGENRLKAGFKNAPKFKWSDAKANPIQDLVDMYRWANDTNKFVGVFRMSEKTFNALADHPTTRTQVQIWITNGAVLPENASKMPVSVEDVTRYLTTKLGLPAIEVVKWSAGTLVTNEKTQNLEIKGQKPFADDVVLLRPSGKIGKYEWKRPSNLFATAVNPMYYAEGGMTAIQQLINSGNRSALFEAESHALPVPHDVANWVYLSTEEVSK